MSATLHTTLTNECHSFVSEQYTEKRDAPKRIPRPPNAFMLYRSDFLKRQVVPPEVEKRQQNLSRIAGQCWNMLPETEKAIWFSRADIVRAAHHDKFHSHQTGPFHKGTNRLSAKDRRRGSATNSGRSFNRAKNRRTRTPYCEGMFAALHDSKISSPESKPSPIFPICASVSPLSTIASLSPMPLPHLFSPPEPQPSLIFPSPSESPLSSIASLSPISLPHLLPPFTSPTHSSRQDSPSATSENSSARRGKFGYLLDSSDSETPQWGLPRIIRGLENTPSEIGSSREACPTLEQYQDDFASSVPYPGLGQLPESRSDPVAQVPLTLPGPNLFSPPAYPSALCRSESPANDFNVTDDVAHFNQSFSPWQSDELNIYK